MENIADLYSFLQAHCPNRPFYDLIKTLGDFKRAVSNSRWLKPQPLNGPVTVVSLDTFERCTGSTFDVVHSVSIREIQSVLGYLDEAAAAQVICTIIQEACVGQDSDPAQKFLMRAEPATYLPGEMRTALKAACYREATRAVDGLLAHCPHQHVRALLMHNVAQLLFNFCAPHLQERRVRESDRYRPAASALAVALFLDPLRSTKKQALYWAT